MDEIVEAHVSGRDGEADGGLLARGQPGRDLVRRQAQAQPVVHGHLLPGELLFLQGVQALLSAEAAVRRARVQEAFHARLVQARPLALPVWPVVPPCRDPHRPAGPASAGRGRCSPRAPLRSASGRCLRCATPSCRQDGGQTGNCTEPCGRCRRAGCPWGWGRSGRGRLLMIAYRVSHRGRRPAAAARQRRASPGRRPSRGRPASAAGPLPRSATAWAMMPSPRPVNPMPSVVVPRKPDPVPDMCNTSARRALMASRCGAIRGCSHTTTSPRSPRQPFRRTRSATWAAAACCRPRRNAGSVSGK